MLDGGFLARHLALQCGNVGQEQGMGFALVGFGSSMIFFHHLQVFPNTLVMAMQCKFFPTP